MGRQHHLFQHEEAPTQEDDIPSQHFLQTNAAKDEAPHRQEQMKQQATDHKESPHQPQAPSINDVHNHGPTDDQGQAEKEKRSTDMPLEVQPANSETPDPFEASYIYSIVMCAKTMDM